MKAVEKKSFFDEYPWLIEFCSRFSETDKLNVSLDLSEFYANLVKNYFKSTSHEYDLSKIVLSILCLNNERPMSKRQIFRRIQIKHVDLTYDLFQEFFRVFSKFFLIPNESSMSQSSLSLFNTNQTAIDSSLKAKKYKLFHSSLGQWLSKSWNCSFAEANEILTLYYFSKLCTFSSPSILNRTSTTFFNINNLNFDFVDQDYSTDELICLKVHIKNLKHLSNFCSYFLKCKSSKVTKSIQKILDDHLDFLDLNASERLNFLKLSEDEESSNLLTISNFSMINSSISCSDKTLRCSSDTNSKQNYFKIEQPKAKNKFLYNFRRLLLSCFCKK